MEFHLVYLLVPMLPMLPMLCWLGVRAVRRFRWMSRWYLSHTLCIAIVAVGCLGAVEIRRMITILAGAR